MSLLYIVKKFMFFIFWIYEINCVIFLKKKPFPFSIFKNVFEKNEIWLFENFCKNIYTYIKQFTNKKYILHFKWFYNRLLHLFGVNKYNRLVTIHERMSFSRKGSNGAFVNFQCQTERPEIERFNTMLLLFKRKKYFDFVENMPLDILQNTECASEILDRALALTCFFRW